MIVVAGEALVDLVPTTGGALLPQLGGGPYNVAVAAGRLDAPTAFLSRVSTDAFGDALVARLKDAQVDVSLIQRGPEPTTLAVVGLAPDGSARYGFYVEGTADRLVVDPGPLPADAQAVSFGTLSMVLEPGASVYESLLRRESARGLLTALDPNVRPVLIPDADAYRTRFRSWLPDVGLLKVSIEDARWLAGDADAMTEIRAWQQIGPAAVVITRGGDGLAVLIRDGQLVEVPPVRVSVVDTIGAGDTVQGALLAWLHRHGVLSKDAVSALTAQEWRAALAFAGAAAAITVSRAGAEPPRSAEMTHQQW
ncbi:carbohydrate kinase [Kutzneria sp. 744]|uniref:carbohydrate kinase family protein n=1 Tax=Kutzneria sp. (strain 744) TaxID=345341 RepID=UPI0003EEC65A|nr:carbohydrate kinase [Kutzneria sp. 744]EWM14265.1 fructokinase [Kutzneria sp. 744]